MTNPRSVPVGWVKQKDGSYSPPTATMKVTRADVDAMMASMGMHPVPSTDEAKLNKTEAAYLQLLRTFNYKYLGIQNITLKLADDCRYSCDFNFIDGVGLWHFHEVKGFFRDDAKVKIKVAARLFPMFHFCVVRKTKEGWDFTEVKP